MKLYGCAYDSIWEITCISFMPTLFDKFSVVVEMVNHFTLEKKRLEFISNDYQPVFERFQPLPYFEDKFPEHFL
jgi:hypothetical protein